MRRNKIRVLKIIPVILILLLVIMSVYDRGGQYKYKYLAIGNSLTKHEITDFWWDEIGMAASSSEHDFFHLVTAKLEERYGKTDAKAVKFKEWEVQSDNRESTFSIIDEYLDDEVNLITLQLGENANDISTFEEDYRQLIYHIKENAPNAKILAVGDFWELDNRDEIKEQVAKECQVTYVSLDEIKENQDYMVGMGAVVFDAEGKEHVIQDYAVAAHPGDNGMEYIANAILDHISD